MIRQLNELNKGTFTGALGIEFLDAGEGFITASMPVENKLQPMGYLHGGASLALAETVASCGSYLLVNPEVYSVFGLQVSASHISAVSQGMLYARADVVHRGQSTHVWDVKISSENGKLISVARVTMMVVKKKSQS